MYHIIILDGNSWTPLDFPDIIKGRYKISINGEIFDLKKQKEVKPWISEKGYCIVALESVHGHIIPKKLHRIVAYNFISANIFDGMTVNHISGNKLDNSIYNLELMTFAENIRHSYKLGLNTPRRGELNGTSKVTEKCVHDICKLISDGLYPSKILPIISNDYNLIITKDIIYDIKRKRTWKHISQEYF